MNENEFLRRARKVLFRKVLIFLAVFLIMCGSIAGMMVLVEGLLKW